MNHFAARGGPNRSSLLARTRPSPLIAPHTAIDPGPLEGVCAQKKGAMLSWHPFACSISVIRLPAIAFSAWATVTAAATGTLLHRFRFIDR